MPSVDPHAPLPPHPNLTEYYADSSAKRAFLQQIFDETAPDYDHVERVLALGSGRWYRRRALRRAGLGEGMTVLDVATGTGLVAREALSVVGPGGRVIGIDPSPGMIAQARRQLTLPIVRARGEQLPFADATFDFLSMGYALRHLSDLRAALREYRRVLKPGGRLCLLEIIKPDSRLGTGLLAAYFRGLLPILSRAVATRPRTGDLWRYYWETIDQCVPPAAVLDALAASDLTRPACHRELGLFAEYTATRPAE